MATTIPPNDASFDRDEVVSATDANLGGPKWDRVSGIVTDSRAVRRGNLFVALRGERFDGHDFLQTAIDAGALAVVVDGDAAVPEGVSVVRVDDTLRALGDLAHAHRLRWDGTLVGITGSVGKTTTKELAAAALEAAGRRVMKTLGNLNNLVGVPMTLFQLDDASDTAVVEMGTNAPGEIARLAQIAAPEVGVVTHASLAHTEGLGTLEAVADEKIEMVRALTSDGVAVTFGDIGILKKRAAVTSAGRKIFYGKAAENDVRVLEWSVEGLRTQASAQVRGRNVQLELQLLGEGAVINAAGALAIVLGLDLPIDDAVPGLLRVPPPPGRLCPREGSRQRLIIDDTYNANPASLQVAVATAKAVAERQKSPLVVVLGDMKELGEHSDEAHRAVGELVADADVFLFVGCGSQMHLGVDEANARGVDTLWFEDASDCSELADRLPLESVVLVKGSRSMGMERAIEPLLEGDER